MLEYTYYVVFQADFIRVIQKWCQNWIVPFDKSVISILMFQKKKKRKNENPSHIRKIDKIPCLHVLVTYFCDG